MPRHLGAVTHRINIGHIGTERSVGHDAAIHLYACVTGQPRARPHTNCTEHRVGFNGVAVVECDHITLTRAVHLCRQRTKVECGALRFQCSLHRPT